MLIYVNQYGGNNNVNNKPYISFIGGGNMASAIIDAILASGLIPRENIFVSDPSEKAKDTAIKKGINFCSSNTELAKKGGILFLAVKPQIIDSVLESISGNIKSDCIVSIAAGVSVSHIKSKISESVPVIRTLPNTPMLILSGMTVVAEAPDVPSDIFSLVLDIFKAAGEVLVLPESKINEAIPMSSSSPAFFFRMLNAMAHAAESHGMQFSDALKLSAAAMEGSAKIVLNGDKTPEELIAQVSSPGGTTLAALSAFDEFNFEKFTDEFVKRCIDRAYELGSTASK